MSIRFCRCTIWLVRHIRMRTSTAKDQPVTQTIEWICKSSATLRTHQRSCHSHQLCQFCLFTWCLGLVLLTHSTSPNSSSPHPAPSAGSSSATASSWCGESNTWHKWDKTTHSFHSCIREFTTMSRRTPSSKPWNSICIRDSMEWKMFTQDEKLPWSKSSWGILFIPRANSQIQSQNLFKSQKTRWNIW